VIAKVEARALGSPRVGGAGIELRRVERRYGRRPGVLALEGLDLEVRPGEVVAVVGPSGSGKSTLLEVVAGLAEPTAGSVAVGGAQSPAARVARCAYMPQRDLLLPWRTALDNAALALECRGVRRRAARERARALFERFGLAGFERARPRELSQGMRQRVAFLRTLLADRPVLALDEPFAALDAITRASLQTWLAGALEEQARTVLLVTHDVEEALFLADRVAVLSPRSRGERKTRDGGGSASANPSPPGPAARIVAELQVGIPRPRPRRETVTGPAFAALKERALEALGC
jgi:NitT/TauT family transport system ATP-binding protein